MDWLTYSGGTDRPGELCCNFSISNDLTEMVRFPTRTPDCDSHSPIFDLFLSSDARICSKIVFPLLGNPDHIVDSVSIDFLSNSKNDVPFHHIIYDHSPANWDRLQDYLRDVLWEDIQRPKDDVFCIW